jgi:hypothetical protein
MGASETVLRSPVFDRPERFIMAIFSFRILTHLFNLMVLPKADEIKKRWEKKDVSVVTLRRKAIGIGFSIQALH